MSRRALIPLIAAALVAALLLIVATFDWGMLKGTVEKRASAALDRRVTIGRIERIDSFGLTPHLRLQDVRVGQPGWAGEGDMLVVKRIDLRLPLLPLLVGKTRPESLAISGLRVSLLHMDDPRANWKFGEPGKGGPLCIDLAVSDARATLVDHKRKLRATATITADARGFRIAGQGTQRGAPLKVSFTGAPIDGHACDAPYPFRAVIESSLNAMTVEGRMAGDFNTAAFTAKGSARGQNLEYLDDIILAGLPGTQPFRVAGTLRHSEPDWIIEQMDGTIGRSTFSGPLKILKRGTRTVLDGDIRSARFDPNDLASNAGKARAAARLAKTGPRVIPYFEIDLSSMRDTSGRLGVNIDQLLLGPPFVGASGTLRMDAGLLTFKPLTVRLTQGTITGQVSVDHRQGAPKFASDLSLRGARLGALLKGQADAPLSGHIRLSGTGSTIRDALARGRGEVVLAARGGWIRESTAQFLGENAGAGLFAGKNETKPLNCMVMRMRGENGLLRADPFVIDTGVSRADVTGSVNLMGETVDMRLKGSARNSRVIRLPAPIEIGGTLSATDIGLAKVKGGLFGKIGRAIGGSKEPDAPPADCPALVALVKP